MKETRTGSARGVEQGDEGFMLVGLIVALFLILLALSVAAPRVAQDLRRDREVEAVHRGNQYVRAIRLYYRKMNNTYPGSMEQLEKSNNIRFLRQRYVDPMTGKDDWRLIHVGEAKTKVKGFFGQPLAGLAPGLGTAAGMASPGVGGSSPAPGGLGSPTLGGGGAGSSSPGIGMGSATSGATSATPGGGPGATSGTGSSASGQTSTLGSAGAIASTTTTSSFSGSGGAGPFVGVGTPKEGDSITVLNEQTTYNTWEFIYDPRIEQMYAKASLFGGGPATGGTGLGSASGMSSGFGTSPTTPGTGAMPGSPSPTAPTSPTTPTPPQQPQ